MTQKQINEILEKIERICNQHNNTIMSGSKFDKMTDLMLNMGKIATFKKRLESNGNIEKWAVSFIDNSIMFVYVER